MLEQKLHQNLLMIVEVWRHIVTGNGTLSFLSGWANFVTCSVKNIVGSL